MTVTPLGQPAIVAVAVAVAVVAVVLSLELTPTPTPSTSGFWTVLGARWAIVSSLQRRPGMTPRSPRGPQETFLAAHDGR